MNATLRPSPRMLRDPVVFFALGGGSGLTPKLPGTAGTLAAAAVYALALRHLPPPLFALFVAAAAIAGVYLCAAAEKRLGARDHPAVVWDEFVGLWAALLWLPFNWPTLLLAIAGFRVLDILKPPPISHLEKLPAGWGVMADDLAAGLIVCALLHASRILMGV